jgi:hypothetical protein
VKRRDFITLLGGAVAWPAVADGQQAGATPRIGALIAFAKGDPETEERLAGFRQGLAKRGWVEGRNIHIDYRFAAGRGDQFPVLAKELVALQPDVILGHTPGGIVALQRETAGQRSPPNQCGLRFSPAGSFVSVVMGNHRIALLKREPDTGDMFRRAAPYIDRILRGVKPAELPVQLPTKFQMAVNLKTAKALDLGVTVIRPPKLLESVPERRDMGLCFQVVLGIAHQHTDPPHSVQLLRVFQPLAGHRRFRKDETGDIAARPGEARDEAAADRVRNDRKNNGDGARLLQQCSRGGCGVRKNEVGLERDELFRAPSPRLCVVRCRPASIKAASH